MLSSRSNIIPISPQLTSPVRSAQSGKLRVQFSRCDTLHHIHHLCWRISRRTTDEQMHVIRLYGQCFNLPTPCRANLLDQLLQPQPHIARQHPAAIAGYPDKVIRQSVNRMGASSSLHIGHYSMGRSRGPLCGPHGARRTSQRTAVPAKGGPAFLPAASGGVSSRRFA